MSLQKLFLFNIIQCFNDHSVQEEGERKIRII